MIIIIKLLLLFIMPSSRMSIYNLQHYSAKQQEQNSSTCYLFYHY